MMDDFEEDDDGGSCFENCEKQGRWTAEEHQLFLTALKTYGREVSF